jgi:MobA/MobL family
VREAEEHGWRVPPRMTTKNLRVAWCEHLNAEMQRHGLEARFDQRTLKAQGIDREPQIHVGPKAMSMAENDRSFESRDRNRGGHFNVYSLLDAGSRAEYNSRIIQDNHERAARKANGHAPNLGCPPGPEGLEKRRLHERQAADCKAMYQEQKHDRAALREAHDAQKLEHQRWGRAHYAAARERAFQEIKAQNADRWKDIRKIKATTQREEAAQALKIESKAAYAEAAKRQIDAARPAKEEAWQKLKLAQDCERKELQARHAEEIAAMSRQQIAERHALHERWQHHNLSARSAQASAKLETRQDMASVQRTAVAVIKLRAAQNRHGQNPHTQTATPSLAVAAHLAERGKTEQTTRETIRTQLTAQRQLNHIRAAAPAQRRRAPGRMAERHGANRARIQAQRQTRQQSDQHSAIRQAIASGPTLTSAERANASAEIKTALASYDKRNHSRREDAFLRFVTRQRSDKGRNGNGGRSGR